jgi:hypothetical protein
MKKIIVIILLTFSAVASAQVKIGDNTNVRASNSTLLELESTNKTLVVNRVASTNSITNPINGMIVYVIADNKFKIYQNNSWTNLFN